MKITLLDAATLGEDLSHHLFDEFGEVRVYEISAAEDVAEHIGDSDVVIINKVKLGPSNLASAKSLKLICIAATGFDNVDLAYCRSRGIAVCNVVGYSTPCVAQVTVAMALSLITHLPEYDACVRSGEYTACGIPNRLTPVYHEIAGKTWGILGFGNIGKQVGRVAEALGCRVLVHKRTPIEGVECVDLDRLCRESDILSIHTPLNDSTRGLLDANHIGMLRREAIVINVARGAVTDECALADAVREGRIGALGVDVYSTEPFPTTHPFYSIKDYPNVCLTPHMAWGGFETRTRVMTEMAENIRDFLAGGRRNRVD